MIPRALDHGGGARQTNRKALARHATEVSLARGGPIHHRVAHDDVFTGHPPEVETGTHHHAPTRQAFAGVVVGVAYQVKRDAACQERTKRLSTGAFELNAQSVIGQTFGVNLGERTGEHGAHRAVHIAGDLHELNTLALINRCTRLGNQHVIQGFLETMVLGLGVIERRAWIGRRCVQETSKIQPTRLPMLDPFFHVQEVGLTDHLLHGLEAQLRHDLAHLFGHKEEEIDDVFGLAGEFFPQNRVLCGHTHGAGVQVAFAHHDATLDHQGCRRKTKFIGTEQGGDGHIATGFHLTVGLHANALPESIHHQGLLGLGQTDLPRRSGVLDGRPR